MKLLLPNSEKMRMAADVLNAKKANMILVIGATKNGEYVVLFPKELNREEVRVIAQKFADSLI